MKRRLFALAVMILAVAGCQDRHLMNAGSSPGGSRTGIPSESIESFAKEYGMSEREAVEHLRKGQTLPRKSQQIAADPPVNSSVRRTDTRALGLDAEPFGEATASDASSGSLERPQSDFGSSMIRTTGGFGPKTY